MKQNRIKLTESQLKRMVSEAVKNVLKEGQYDDYYNTPSREGEKTQVFGDMYYKLMADYTEAYVTFKKKENEIKDAVNKYLEGWDNFMANLVRSGVWINANRSI